jgi:hypothetical protein
MNPRHGEMAIMPTRLPTYHTLRSDYQSERVILWKPAIKIPNFHTKTDPIETPQAHAIAGGKLTGIACSVLVLINR